MHRKYSERSELARLFACQRFIRGIKCRSFGSLPCATVQRYFKILRYRHTSLSVLQPFHPKLDANSIFRAKYPLFLRYTECLCHWDGSSWKNKRKTQNNNFLFTRTKLLFDWKLIGLQSRTNLLSLRIQFRKVDLRSNVLYIFGHSVHFSMFLVNADYSSYWSFSLHSIFIPRFVCDQRLRTRCTDR